MPSSFIIPRNRKHFSSASAYLPLLYDTVVVLLTIYRTVGQIRQRTAGKIMRVLLRDGLLYYRSVWYKYPAVSHPVSSLTLLSPYSVIFAINLILTLMIAFAPPGLQNVTAQYVVPLHISLVHFHRIPFTNMSLPVSQIGISVRTQAS